MRFDDLVEMDGVALYSNQNRDSSYVDVDVEFVPEIGKRSFKVASSRRDPGGVKTTRWHDMELRSSEHACALREIEDVGIDDFGVDPSSTNSGRQRLLHLSSAQ